MGYDTGAQAGEDGSSPSRGFKYGFVVFRKKLHGFIVP
jgi:hypothetical protein